MNNIIYTLIGIIAITTIFIVILLLILREKQDKLKELQKNYNSCNSERLLANSEKLTALQLKDNYQSNSNLLARRNEELRTKYDKLLADFNTVKQNPLKFLRFYLDNGDIANTVKVKTITIKNSKKVINVVATVRKRIDNKYQDIKVKSKLDNI